MPVITKVWVNRLTVEGDKPVRSARSPFPSQFEPGRNALRISMPRTKDRLMGESPSRSPASSLSTNFICPSLSRIDERGHQFY
jgi:hypothetical protein